MKLSIPNIKYKDSFISALYEFKAEGRPYSEYGTGEIKLKLIRSNFADYVHKLIAQSKGKRLPKSWVPATSYWITENNEYIGTINLRHRLTTDFEKRGGHVGYAIRPTQRKKGYGTKALKMLLPIAFKMGLKRILITCNTDNIGSIKVIKANGGILQDQIQNKGRKVLTRRYWVDTKD